MGKISGINCGTTEAYEPADLTVYLQDRGVVLKEKFLLAYNSVTGKIVAMGTQAEQMTQTEGLLVRSPLRQGAVADFEMAVVLFTYVLRKALGKRRLWKPAVAICVPPGMTSVEKRAVEETFLQTGAGQLILSDLPAQQFMATLPQQNPGLCRKFKTIISIEKDNSDRYVMEQLSHLFGYAQRMGISPEKVLELLESAGHCFQGEK